MASADLSGRVLPRADTADLRLMLCSSFALACTTVLVRGRRAQTPISCIRSLFSALVASSIRGPGCETQASDQLADVNQGIVFRLLSLSGAYLCAIEEEASVTLRYLQTLPLQLT